MAATFPRVPALRGSERETWARPSMRTRYKGRCVLYRYLFYGWLFRDASAGTYLERAAALAYNREQSRWLPRYLLRWLTIAACSLALARFCDHVLANHALSALFYVLTTLTMVFNAVTAACWRVLRSGAR